MCSRNVRETVSLISRQNILCTFKIAPREGWHSSSLSARAHAPPLGNKISRAISTPDMRKDLEIKSARRSSRIGMIFHLSYDYLRAMENEVSTRVQMRRAIVYSVRCMVMSRLEIFTGYV